MPTHITQCVVCAKDVYCSQDEHALGCGGSGRLDGCGGCENPPYIEFCSLEHALELRRRLDKSIANYYEVTGTSKGEAVSAPAQQILTTGDSDNPIKALNTHGQTGTCLEHGSQLSSGKGHAGISPSASGQSDQGAERPVVRTAPAQGEPPPDNALGLSIDMLDADRLRNWARNIDTFGADMTHWSRPNYVAGAMRTLADSIEQAVRDIGVLRSQSASSPVSADLLRALKKE